MLSDRIREAFRIIILVLVVPLAIGIFLIGPDGAHKPRLYSEVPTATQFVAMHHNNTWYVSRAVADRYNWGAWLATGAAIGIALLFAILKFTKDE